MTVQPTCYLEVVSLAQFVENGQTVNRYINEFSTKVAAYYPDKTDNSLLSHSITKSSFNSWFLSTISECSVNHWEIWKDNGAGTWSGSDLVKVTDSTGLIWIDSNYDVKYLTHNNQVVKNNWYNKFILRGYSKARENAEMAKDITADMVITIDVCGNEAINTSPVSGNSLDLLQSKTLKVESGTSRTQSFQIGAYTSTSVNYPSWHTDSGK